MPQEKKTTTTRKKTTTSTTKKTSSNTKKPTTRKTSTTKPKSSTTKKSTTTKPKTSTTKKTTTSKPKASSSTTKKASTTTKKKPTTQKPKTQKTTSKAVKTVENSTILSSKEVKTVKPKTSSPRKRKPKKQETARVKKEEELTTLEMLEAKSEHKEITEKQPKGKTFYLIFGLLFYAGAFFYINNIVYDNQELLQSAIFAFAAMFIFFVLLLFSVPQIILAFFVLPFRRLLKQARQEVHKEIIYSVGSNKIQTTWNKYQSIFTLVIYTLIAGVLLYATIQSGIMNDYKVLKIVTNSVLTFVAYVAVLCSWQYMFNIIPSVLEKSIDAKNGFILTLSAVVMIIYVVFLIFDIYAIAEIMIFVLIIGFIALLGVNMNMIVGEINIFSNLRDRKSKAVTRVVFSVFFGFHIYVILYASVVAYSIYNWQPDAFVFSENETVLETVTSTYDQNGSLVEEIYYYNSTTETYDVLDSIYDETGIEITVYQDANGVAPSEIYASDGTKVEAFYNNRGFELNPLYTEDGYICNTNSEYFIDGTLGCTGELNLPHTYGAFLYWTVVTVSTIGYGDIHPSTDYNIAMVWGGFLGLYGLTFFALSISFVSNIAMEGVNSVREASRKND